MLKAIDYQGQYLMLYFTPGYVSQMRGETFATEAAKHPEIRQVAAYYPDGDSQKSYQATLKTLDQYPQLKMIFANTTDIAMGALKALKECNRLDVLLNG